MRPKCLVANGLWNVFTNKKKYTITCGNCSHTYSDKVYFIIDDASSICPNCKKRNKWKHSAWEKTYNEQMGL